VATRGAFIPLRFLTSGLPDGPVFTEKMVSEDGLLRLEDLLEQVAHVDRAKATELLVNEEIIKLATLFGN